jgi:hypothetical protein
MFHIFSPPEPICKLQLLQQLMYFMTMALKGYNKCFSKMYTTVIYLCFVWVWTSSLNLWSVVGVWEQGAEDMWIEETGHNMKLEKTGYCSAS